MIHLLPVRNGKHWATLNEIHNLDHITHTVTVKTRYGRHGYLVPFANLDLIH